MITRQQVAIILVIIGTALLAFSVRVKRQYEGQIGKVVDVKERGQPLNRDKIEPVSNHYAKTTEIRICRSVLPYNRQMK